jgi:hypothetical protein
MTDAMDRCADEMREIRTEMNRGFDFVRASLREVQEQLAEGSKEIALNSRNIEILQDENERRWVKHTAPTPVKGVPTIPESKAAHWAVQAAIIAVISLGTSSFVGFLLHGYAKHVAESQKTPGAGP